MYLNYIRDYTDHQSLADYGGRRLLGAPSLTHFINYGNSSDKCCFSSKNKRKKNLWPCILKGVLCAGAAVGAFFLMKKGACKLGETFSKIKESVLANVRKIFHRPEGSGSGSVATGLWSKIKQLFARGSSGSSPSSSPS